MTHVWKQLGNKKVLVPRGAGLEVYKLFKSVKDGPAGIADDDASMLNSTWQVGTRGKLVGSSDSSARSR